MGITYSKLFNTLPDSTIWAEPNPTRICWITMLAMADQFGRVYSSIPGLANRARISMDETEVALATFFAPDRYSRTPDHEGRRIAQIDGGWRLLNHSKFRELQDEEAQKARKAKNARDYRERHRVTSPPSPNITTHHPIAEADTTTKAKVITETVVTTDAVVKNLPRGKREVDPRHTPFRGALEKYWEHKNPATPEMPWEGRDAKALTGILAASPNLTLEQFREMLRHRARSQVAHGDRVYLWIAKVHSYTEPLNQYNRPEGSNGKNQQYSVGAAVGRVNRGLEGLRKAAEASGDYAAGPDDRGDGGVLPAPGNPARDADSIPRGVQANGRGAQPNQPGGSVVDGAAPIGTDVFPPPHRGPKGA